MLQAQKQVKQMTFAEFQSNLLRVLTNVAEEKKPYIVTVMGFPAVFFKLEAQELNDLGENKSIDSVKKLVGSLVTDEGYEARHRAWRRSIIEKTAGVIKDTRKLDKELRERRTYELRAAKKMGKW